MTARERAKGGTTHRCVNHEHTDKPEYNVKPISRRSILKRLRADPVPQRADSRVRRLTEMRNRAPTEPAFSSFPSKRAMATEYGRCRPRADGFRPYGSARGENGVPPRTDYLSAGSNHSCTIGLQLNAPGVRACRLIFSVPRGFELFRRQIHWSRWAPSVSNGNQAARISNARCVPVIFRGAKRDLVAGALLVGGAGAGARSEG